MLTEEYAAQMARDWNTKHGHGGRGFVTRFRVRAEFLRHYDVRTVGGRAHREYWIPAADLPEFNRHLVGPVEVIAEFGAGQ